MRVFEYGAENREVFVLLQCAVEPWWVFEASAKAMARDYHVFLFNADGHDEQGTDFISIERSAEEAAAYFRDKGIRQIDVMYGVSMGGATVIRFLAAQAIPVKKAIIDAGITPYPYPKAVCRLIAAWDFLTVSLATKNDRIMKLAAPPERWTPKDEDSEEHYQRIFDFEKNHLSAKTIYNVFWSTNNYSMPEPIPTVDTEIEYWYGEKEKRVRRNDIAYTCKVFPQTVVRELAGLAHAELVLMFPERFYQEVVRFTKDKDGAPKECGRTQ